MDVKYFSGAIELRPTEGKEGKFKALVCTFGIVDKGGDVVHRGAFAASLARLRGENARISVFYNHDHDDLPLGDINPHNAIETETGLVVSGELFLHNERAAELYRLIKRKTVREWSFGCRVQSDRPRPEGGRDFFGLDLFEVSATILGKGTTETLMVASALVPEAVPPSSQLTPAERLAPYWAEYDVLRQRVTRTRRDETETQR